jgi:hypothetical protein
LSEIRLYIDEDSQSDAILAFLRDSGLDVLSSKEAGMDGRADEDQLAFASRTQRVLLTANIRDYRTLHAAAFRTGDEPGHSGLIYWTRDLSVGELGRRMLRLHAALSAEEVAGREEFLSAWGEQRT